MYWCKLFILFTGATSEAGPVYPSWAPEFTQCFRCGWCCSQSLVFCVVLCELLFVYLSFILWSSYCLSFAFRKGTPKQELLTLPEHLSSHTVLVGMMLLLIVSFLCSALRIIVCLFVLYSLTIVLFERKGMLKQELPIPFRNTWVHTLF